MTITIEQTNFVPKKDEPVAAKPEFTSEQILAKAEVILKGKTTIPTQTLLKDSSFRDTVVAILRKEKQARENVERLKAMSILEGELEVLNNAPKQTKEDMATRKSLVFQKQGDYRSPDFVFKSLDMAGSWRWLLLNLIIGFRNLRKSVDQTTLDGRQLGAAVFSLQTHIDCADIVLTDFYGVNKNDFNEFKVEVDRRDEVEDLIVKGKNEAGCDYSMHRDLLIESNTTLRFLRAKYTAPRHAGNNADSERQESQNPHQDKKRGKKQRG